MTTTKGIDRVFSAYLLTTFLCCLLIPESLGLASLLGIAPESIPVYSWIANVPGVRPFYPDFFILSWALLPVWLLAYGFTYLHQPPLVRPTSSQTILLSIGSLVFLSVVFFFDMDASDYSGRAAEILGAAARLRWFGAMFFSSVFMLFFAMFALILVLTPYTIIRGKK